MNPLVAEPYDSGGELSRESQAAGATVKPIRGYSEKLGRLLGIEQAIAILMPIAEMGGLDLFSHGLADRIEKGLAKKGRRDGFVRIWRHVAFKASKRYENAG